MKTLGWLCLLVSLPALAKDPVVVIDPGHGGNQGGAIGPGDYLEKTFALELSKKLKTALISKVGARVLLTRERDLHVQLEDRVAVANKVSPDLFISIHANSMPTQGTRAVTSGAETYFLSAEASGEDARKVAARENAEARQSSRGGDALAYILADLQRAQSHGASSKLAYAVHGRLVAASGQVDRGVQQAPFYVLMGVEAPAILVEVGFISHPDEGQKLREPEFQQKVADAIAGGVQAFLSAAPGGN